MADLMTALRNADAAGDTEAAKRIAAMIKAEQPTVDEGMRAQYKNLLLRQARGEEGLSSEISSMYQQLSEQQSQRPAREIPQPETIQNAAPFIKDLFTGENRTTPELESLPSLGAAPEFNEFSGESIKSNIATFTTGDEKELEEIFKNQYGERVSFSKDSKGNRIVNFPSGSYSLNKPGLSAQDVPKFFGDLAAFTPAGRSGTIMGAAAKSGAGEATLEGIDTSLGGDFSAGDVALSASLGGAFKSIEKVISKIYGSIKGASSSAPIDKSAEKDVIKEVVTDEAIDDIAKAIKTGTNDDLAKLVDADPKFYQAADELGISTEPLASFASKNPQFVSIESGLASVPSSHLDVQTKAFIREAAEKADDLIERYGGTLDKGQLNVDFKRQAIEVIDDLSQQADDAYSSIAKNLPKSGRYAAPETISFIKGLSKEVGGVKELPPKLRKIFNDLTPKIKTKKGKTITNAATGIPKTYGASEEVINPTLGKIDHLRREIGQALSKKSGAFKDAEEGLLKALYARLRTDLDSIAKEEGFQSISETASSLIVRRKQLEDNLKTLLGKDLNKSLSINVGGAVKNLAKGDIARFNKVIDAIPKKQRGEVVLSAMNDVFKGTGVNQQSLSPNQFVKWYESINRSPSIKKNYSSLYLKNQQRQLTTFTLYLKELITLWAKGLQRVD